MNIFALRKIEAVVGKQDFFELLENGISQFENYFLEVKKNPQYYSELKTILAYMNVVADLKSPPAGKVKYITPKKESVSEMEFRSKHLRVYCFQLKRTGQVVAFGGYKNSQDDDIRKFRSSKQRFLKTIKP